MENKFFRVKFAIVCESVKTSLTKKTLGKNPYNHYMETPKVVWQVYVLPGISNTTTFKYYLLGSRQLINVRKKKKTIINFAYCHIKWFRFLA